MVVGVIAFYFVLSDINSIISSGIKYDMDFSLRVTMLEKIQEKYRMRTCVYRQAKKTIFSEEEQQQTLDLPPFFRQFPRSLRQSLKFSAYSRDFAKSYFGKYVDPLIVNCLGDAARVVHIPASAAPCE